MQEENKVFYIIGAGPSYRDVTEEQWKFLEDKNAISFARVPYGSRKTNHYISIERVEADKSVLKYMAFLGWLDTKLYLLNRESIEYAKELGFKKIQRLVKQTFYFMPSRKPWFTDEPEPPHSFYETRAKHFHQPIFRFRGQLSAVINTCLILGATEIRLIGIDMNDQWNFYHDYDYFDKHCHSEETRKEWKEYMGDRASIDRLMEKKKYNEGYDPKTMHTTNMPYYEKDKWNDRALRGISDVIQWMDKEMRKEGMEGIFVTNKISLLYKENKLRYRGIDEVSQKE